MEITGGPFCKLLCLSLVFLLVLGSKPNNDPDLITLDENNWTNMLQGEWIVEFFAPWCPACKGLEDTWRSFAKWGTTKGIQVAQVDVTASPGLSGRFMVTALPTIYHVINGEFRQYKGSRDRESFVQFIAEKKWQQVDTVPYWKSPDSIQMTVVSSFFKISQTLRVIHTKLMEDFGLPQWGSYLIFALATIVLGAILGLVLVCIIDLIFPPKAVVYTKTAKADDTKTKSSDDELGDEDIKDDLLDDARTSDEEKEKEEQTKSNPSSPKIKKRKARRADD